MDKWILNRFENTLKQVENHFKTYRFDLASHAFMILLGMNTVTVFRIIKTSVLE